MGRLAEMQRKLLEVCVSRERADTHNAPTANDGSRSHGRCQRKFGMVRRKGLPELSVWDMSTCVVHEYRAYPRFNSEWHKVTATM